MSKLIDQLPILFGFSIHCIIYYLLVIAIELKWDWLFSWTWLFYCLAQYSIFFGFLYLISKSFNKQLYVLEGGNNSGNNPAVDLFNFSGQKISAPDLSEDQDTPM